VFLSVLFADSSGDVELCLKCVCDKKVLIKPLYTVSCSHLGLQDTFRNVGQWPEYSQQQETRMAVNFDWNDIKHLKKFPNIPGIVSLSFRHNKMTEIQGSAFVKLDNLKVLDLSYNQLTGNQTYELNLTLLSVLINTANVYIHSVIFYQLRKSIGSLLRDLESKIARNMKLALLYCQSHLLVVHPNKCSSDWAIAM
jgi:hypothetical protein